MQIRDVVQQWCEESNAKLDARESKSGLRYFILFVTVIALLGGAYFGLDHMDFSSWEGRDADRSALKIFVCGVGIMAVMLGSIQFSEQFKSRHSWDSLNRGWQVSDDLLGRLASSGTVPVNAKASIARHLQSGERVTMAHLETLEAELQREQELAGPGHQSILHFGGQ